MKKFRRFIKKYWITIWMLIAIAAVISIPAWAEFYKDRNHEKRVIANISTDGKRFSSDRLNNTSDITPYEVPVSTSGDSLTVPVDFQIFNHVFSNSMEYYPSPFYYKITAKLVDKSGNSISSGNTYWGTNKFGIKLLTDTEYTYFDSYSSTITIDNSFAGEAEENPHKYQLCFNKDVVEASDSNRIYIELDAIPYSTRTGSAGSYSYSDRIYELGELKARLSVMPKAEGISVGWTGQFQEDNDDLDGFNFVFSGSGKSKLVICYDSTKLEINKFFLDDHASDELFTFRNGCYYEYSDPTNKTGWTKTTNANWKTIIIEANSDIANRYGIQLYMKDSVITYSSINSYVKYTSDAPSTNFD